MQGQNSLTVYALNNIKLTNINWICECLLPGNNNFNPYKKEITTYLCYPSQTSIVLEERQSSKLQEQYNGWVTV